MKFMIGTKIEKDAVVLDGANAGFYETNIPLSKEDMVMMSHKDAYILIEAPETKTEIDTIKNSWDNRKKKYMKYLKLGKDKLTSESVNRLT